MTAMPTLTFATSTPSVWCRGECPKKSLLDSRPSGRPQLRKSASNGGHVTWHRHVTGRGFWRRHGYCINTPRQASCIEDTNCCLYSMAASIAGTDNLAVFRKGIHFVHAATSHSTGSKRYVLN